MKNIQADIFQATGTEQLRAALSTLTTDDDLQKFIVEFVKLLRCAHAQSVSAQAEAKLELTTKFGEEILQTDMVKAGMGLIFTLTEDGRQFRCWHGTFGRVEHNHFDSCGQHCAFTLTCKDSGVLYHWVEPIVEDRLRWKCEDPSKKRGYVWLGWPMPHE